MNPSLEIKIGLEIHAQLLTQTKLWCGCEVNSKASPNTLICPVCSAHPGALPRLNTKALHCGMAIAKLLKAELAKKISFDRKNYFYPDLPKGYQITQKDNPLATNGKFSFKVEEEDREIGIVEMHLEEDSGRLKYADGLTLLDLNRAGVALIEIVTAPELKSGNEAACFLRALHQSLVEHELCRGALEEGHMRFDVNISINSGKRVEIKNLNSFRFVELAIEHEILRQAELLKKGGAIENVTLGFIQKGSLSKLVVQRSKEDARGYRFLPERDLPCLNINDLERDNQSMSPGISKSQLLFDQVWAIKNSYDLSEYDAALLRGQPDVLNYFSELMNFYSGSPKKALNWVSGELLSLTNKSNISVIKSPVSPLELSGLLTALDKEEISGKQAKEILEKMYQTGAPANELISSMKASLVQSSAELTTIVVEVLLEHPEQVAEYKKGKERLLSFFVGQVMKKTKGSAHPEKCSDLLKNLLSR